ncbi:MAG: thiamine pyrophosphate-dependent dehydrogenase E1 component subunit alpha [Anaerolineales bacterium]
MIDRDAKSLYRQMLRIRRFEQRVLDWFPKGIFFGTTHTYIGQEADAVGVMTALKEGDIVVSNHRCHGHFLAYGGPMVGLAGELMGRQCGVCGGRAGSQHVQWRDFYANGILGGTAPMAAGMALAEQAQASDALVTAFLGDGALGEGAVYESLNLSSLWQLPVLWVLENNRYAQSTPIEMNLAGSIAARFTSFGIPVHELDSTDVELIAEQAQSAAQSIRADDGPQALLIHTYRFGPHSKGDDFRDPDEIAEFRARDPLPLQAARLDEGTRTSIQAEVEAELEDAFRQAEQSPLADPARLGIALGESA